MKSRFANYIPYVVFCLVPTALCAQQTPPIGPTTVATPIPPALVLPTVPTPSDIPSKPLTANEAARIAVVHQPTLEAARQAVIAAQGRTQQVRSAELPNVTVNAGYTDVESLNTVHGQSSTAVQTFPGYLATAVLNQLLFDFNHTRELVRQSQLLESVAQDNLLKSRFDLVFETKQAYYQYANAVRELSISESSLGNRQKQLDLAQAQLKSGLGLPSDVARAETSKAQGVTALSVARENASNARINLALVMGIDPRTPISITQDGEPAVADTDLGALVNRAIKQRPDMKLAEDALLSTQHGVKAARLNNAPVFSGNIGAGSSGSSFPPSNDAFSIGLSLNWNPFDGGLTAGKVKEARANQAIALAQQQTARLNVVSDVSQAFVSLRNAEQRVVSATNSVTNAREGLRIAVGRFSSGLGLFLDITDAETALESAQSDLTLATMSVDQARAALAHAIGTPVPTTP